MFAYGATGAGKTYTMSGREQVLGPDRRPSGRLRPGNRGRPTAGTSDGTEGLVPRSMQHLFQQISALPPTVTMRIRASFYEIYNEAVYDLLTQRNRRQLQVKDRLLLPGAPHPPEEVGRHAIYSVVVLTHPLFLFPELCSAIIRYPSRGLDNMRGMLLWCFILPAYRRNQRDVADLL